MRISIARADGGRKHVRLQLTDFNRTRWAVFAIQHNAQLQAALVQSPLDEVLLLDSTSPLAHAAPEPCPQGTFIVLWDSLNSTLELFEKAPALQHRSDLIYLPVGCFQEIDASFPARHLALMPQAKGSTSSGHVSGTALHTATSHVQALLRPLKNRRTHPQAHQMLSAGGLLVFCGMVRPNQAVFENFFQGTQLHALREPMAALIGLDWRRKPTELAHTVTLCWQALRDTQAQGAQEWATLYSWANTLHRLGTLCHINALSEKLFVNEYGQGQHIDPYDATAYRHNQFIDFGSTRGPDLIYPRSVDLQLRGKPCLPSRFMAPQGSLAHSLQSTTGADFWALCEAHAHQQVQALALLRA